MSAKSLEIRLGLVLYGGVSLAVYIHGVCRELFDAVRGKGVYGSLKRLLGADIAVDIVSGTSAGGINGIFLARALAAGGDFAKCAKLWRDHGDILALLNDPLATRFENGDSEPPSLLQSENFYERKLREAMEDLGPTPAEDDDAEPTQVGELDVFVTSTDFHGRRWQEKDSRGTPIDVKDHRTVFHLKHRRSATGKVRKSAFVASKDYPEDVITGGLARIARATSAFPVAFRPVPHRPLGEGADKLLREALREMPGVDRDAWYIDGGVLDNKPFTHTLREIAFRATDREVIRKVLYVEPDPERHRADADVAPDEPSPGDAAIGALFGIRGYESIAGDLRDLRAHNQNVQRFRRLAEEVQVDTGTTPRGDDTARFTEAGRRCPTTLRVYSRARVTALRDMLVTVLRRTKDGTAVDDLDQRVERAGEAWSRTLAEPDATVPPGLTALRHYDPVDVAYQTRRHFHTIYRLYARTYGLEGPSPAADAHENARRVLRFLYQQVELLQAAQVALEDLIVNSAPTLVERLSAADAEHPDDAVAAAPIANFVATATHLIANHGLPERTVDQVDEAAAFSRRLDAVYGVLRARARELPATGAPAAAAAISLPDATSRETRAWLQAHAADGNAFAVALQAFDAFPEVDLQLFPLQLLSGVLEPDDLKLVRVSPQDANQSAGYTQRFRVRPADKLCGDAFFHFAGFFQRSWRTNDILWGRLDAAEILIDALVTKDTVARLRRCADLPAELAALGATPEAIAAITADPVAALAEVKDALVRAVQRTIVRDDLPELAYDRVLEAQERREEPRDETRAQEARKQVRASLDGFAKEANWPQFDLVVEEHLIGVGAESIADIALPRVLTAGLGAGILVDRWLGMLLTGRQFLGAGFARGIRGYLAMPMRVLYRSLQLRKLGEPALSWMLAAFLAVFLVLSAVLAVHAVLDREPVLGWVSWLGPIVLMFGLLVLLGRDRMFVRLSLALAVVAAAAALGWFLFARQVPDAWLWGALAAAAGVLGWCAGRRQQPIKRRGAATGRFAAAAPDRRAP